MNMFTPYIQSQQEGRLPRGSTKYESSTAHADSFHHESGDFWCDTCDKGFRTAYHLENHKKAHQKCNIDGCQFIAHPNIITKHIQMQHSTGLYKKICKLNDPEEIKKWREERKKKYPTKQNIEKKAAQIKAKVARGEKMGIYDTTRKRTYKSENSSNQKKSKLSYKNNRNSMYQKKIENKNRCDKTTFKTEKLWKITLPPTEITRTLKPFGGIQHLVCENEDIENEADIPCNNLIEEDEYVSDTPNTIREQESTPENNVCGALSSLMCDYGTSDDEENSDINDKENKTKTFNNKNDSELKIKPNLNNSKMKTTKLIGQSIVKEIKDDSVNFVNKSLPENVVDDDSGPEETKIDKEQVDVQHNDDKPNNKTIEKKSIKPKIPTDFKNKLSHRNNTYRRKLPSTLLEKLLHREIQKERNIILQCVRYIVKNNYFESK